MNLRLVQENDSNSPACIWEQAGVVNKKECFQEYNCPPCRFDRAMRHVCKENEILKSQGIMPSGKKGTFVFWKDKLKKQPMAKQPCIHHMKGRIGFRTCHRDYNCPKCEFDQYFNDQYTVYTVVKPVDFLDISGVKLPTGYYLHPGHTWVKIENNNEVRIGIDDFALRVLGPFDRIEAPLVGKEITQNGDGINVFRSGHQAAFASPVNGVVTALNPALRQQGNLASKDPYTDGWVMMVHCRSLRTDLKKLMFMEETRGYTSHEVDRLYEILEEETGLMAADGGSLGTDIFGNAPGLKWDSLVNSFLKPGT